MSTIFADTPRERLDVAIAHGPAHLRPVWLAVRDANCSLIIVAQGRQRFELPIGRPSIAIVGDDLLESRGPNGFNLRSLRALLGRCRSISIVSCEPLVMAYAAPAAAAGLGLHGAIIETRMRHEADWRHFVEEHAPEAALIIATEKPAGGAH